MKRNEKGFTLIELLIVIGIIAILAAGAIITINPGRQFEQARNATRWSHLNVISSALYSHAVGENLGTFEVDCPIAYESVSGDCTTAGGVWEAGPTGSGTATAEACWTVVNETNCGHLTTDYIQQIPTDPQSTTASTLYYRIRYATSGSNNIIIAPSLSANDDVSSTYIIQ